MNEKAKYCGQSIVNMEQSDFDLDKRDDSDIDVAPAKPKLVPPPMYKVVMLNDDHTPQKFVVSLLQSLFNMDHSKAVCIMLMVHTQGQGVCGVYPRDIAEMKVAVVHKNARQNNYPLKCRIEPE